jgi:hypothetical protein
VTDLEVLEHAATGSLLITRELAEQLRPNEACELSILPPSHGRDGSVREIGRVVPSLDTDRHRPVPERIDDRDESSAKANHPSRGVRLWLVRNPE